MKISDIVKAYFNQNPKGAIRMDFGTVAIFTPEAGTVFKDEKTRFVYVGDQTQVETLFGVDSQTAKCSQPFFAQEPRAKQLIICRWQKAGATIPATKNSLKSATLNNSLASFQAVKNGSFSLLVGGVKKDYSKVDFSAVVDFSGIADKLTETLADASLTVNYDQLGNRFLVTVAQTGADKATILSPLFPNVTTGDYIGDMLKLSDGQAEVHIGTDEITLQAETVGQALHNVSEVNNTWYGLTFAAQLADADMLTVAEFAQANSKLFGLNVIKKSQLEWDDTNVLKTIADKNLDHTLPIFDINDLYPASSALAVLLSMNFSAQNGTLTLKFKQLPTISADELTRTEVEKAKRLGINVYTFYDQTAILAEGTVSGGKFADEIVILDWFKNAVAVAVFNRLLQTPKIPLTDAGQATLVAVVMGVCAEGLNNGAFAPGVWRGSPFGTLKTGDMLEKGYYVWAAPMATLSDSDREQRKATPIQVAVKLAGAIHSVDIPISFDR